MAKGKPELGRIMSVIKDPMVSDHFMLEIPQIPTQAGDVETIMMQCQTATKPGLTVDEVLVALFGHTIVYAGRKTFNHDLNVTFVENVRGEIMQMLEQWAQLIRGTQSQHGAFKAQYATDAYLSIFNNMGDEVIKFKLHNLWPATIPEMSFDGSAANLMTHAVGFKYDHHEQVSGSAKRSSPNGIY